ncbi:MAG: DUF4956 domain-containing protein [Oscillospiraceae bacterium]|nr:DUF4956 domain-containing protein [Oscillospiraceae bacterium]MBR6677365.1 DUF4956 domain-containing protein [Oscillospiraceae bacterium]
MFETVLTGALDLRTFFICIGGALALGMLNAGVFMFRNRYSAGFVTTLTLLSPLVAVVIMLVNGNVGAGVAVAGTFSMIRFRSAPGTAQEICSIFLSVVVGIACGMGYVGLAAIFFVFMAVVTLFLALVRFGESEGEEKELRITVPEDLEYEEMFNDIFAEYTRFHRLDKVKTVNMGTMYELRYTIILSDHKRTKAMIDAIRCRNGNLTVSCGIHRIEEAKL